jgi:hypothetical protein
MINVGFFGVVTVLGILDAILAILLLATSIAPFVQGHSLADTTALLLVIQAIAIPLSLIIAGGIFFFQGWRLDPSLQLAVLLLHITVGFLVAKDFVLFNRR